MSDLIGDFSKEVLGAISTGILVIVMVIALSAIGETTGQTEISKLAINAILMILAISLPIGLIALIKWLMGLGEQYG